MIFKNRRNLGKNINAIKFFSKMNNMTIYIGQDLSSVQVLTFLFCSIIIIKNTRKRACLCMPNTNFRIYLQMPISTGCIMQS